MNGDNMSDKITDKVHFFVGNEVEHTPFFGMRTLFVCGIQDVGKILIKAEEHKCEHIYLGANHSFLVCSDWNKMIHILLGAGYKVTLDYPIRQHYILSFILDQDLMKSKKLVRIASCKLENIENEYKNMLIRIGGTTNTGVWTIPVSEILNEDRKTDWIEYQDDEVVG